MSSDFHEAASGGVTGCERAALHIHAQHQAAPGFHQQDEPAKAGAGHFPQNGSAGQQGGVKFARHAGRALPGAKLVELFGGQPGTDPRTGDGRLAAVAASPDPPA